MSTRQIVIRRQCTFCKGFFVATIGDVEAVIAWEEVHNPFHAPAHRKCTDGCETVACEELARRFERQPLLEGLDDVFSASSPQGED